MYRQAVSIFHETCMTTAYMSEFTSKCVTACLYIHDQVCLLDSRVRVFVWAHVLCFIHTRTCLFVFHVMSVCPHGHSMKSARIQQEILTVEWSSLSELAQKVLEEETER